MIDLIEIKLNFRALLEEFELYCKKHNLDFDETIRKMIDAEIKRYKELGIHSTIHSTTTKVNKNQSNKTRKRGSA